MPPRPEIPNHLVVGVRLNQADRVKLEQLCTATQRPASSVLRLLIRLADTTHIPLLEFRLLNENVKEVPTGG